MSWNKPSPNTVDATSSSRSAGRGKMPRLRSGLFAGLLVVALGALCYFMFRPSAATPKRDSMKDRGLIKEVTPAAAPTNAASAATASKPKREPKLKQPHEFKNPSARLAHEVALLKNVRELHVGDPNRRELFHFASEQQLEGLLQVPFGEYSPDVDLPPNLDEDFLESMKHPILAEKDDTPEEIEMKKAMNKLKIEIAARLKNGEKLADIIHAEKRESNRVAEFRQDTSLFIRDMIKQGETLDDVRAFVEAANKKIAEKGGKPLTISKEMENRIEHFSKRRKQGQ